MKTILFPTDFSENAHHAVKFASELAEKSKSKLILLNVFWFPVYEFDNPPEIQAQEKKLRNDALKELEGLEKEIKTLDPDLKTQVQVVNGFTAQAITDVAKSNSVDLIVMGTKGASGLREVIMGSNTVDVIGKAPCPVLAIPKKAESVKFDHLLFASNFSDTDTEDIEFLTGIGHLYNSHITITHVTEDDLIIETADHAILKKLKRDIKVKTQYPDLSHKLLKGDVIEELNQFIQNEEVDLLSMTTSQKHFLTKVFNKSYTQKMAFHTKIPLLVLQHPLKK